MLYFKISACRSKTCNCLQRYTNLVPKMEPNNLYPKLDLQNMPARNPADQQVNPLPADKLPVGLPANLPTAAPRKPEDHARPEADPAHAEGPANAEDPAHPDDPDDHHDPDEHEADPQPGPSGLQRNLADRDEFFDASSMQSSHEFLIG
jgi:hypothetical protein